MRASNHRRGRAIGVGVATVALLAALAAGAIAASLNFDPLPTSPEAAGDRPEFVTAADLDGDGDRDLAVANVGEGTVTILRNGGDGDFAEPPSSPESVGDDPAAIVAADLDGDGDRDLAVANAASDDVTVLRNNGTGNFGEPGTSPVPVGEFPFSLAALDFDGDGDQDLAVANEFDDNVTILRNNGSGSFKPRGTSPEGVGQGPAAIVAGDLDGDGDQDLAVANLFEASVTMLRNKGSGDFGTPAFTPEPVGTFPRSLVAPDLDGDGDLDLAVANNSSGDVTVLRNRGSGNFVEPATSPEPVTGTPTSIAAADFDLDGDQDLAVANPNLSAVNLLRNLGTGNFNTPATSPEPVGQGAFGVVAVPLDADPDPDLAVAASHLDQVDVLANR